MCTSACRIGRRPPGGTRRTLGSSPSTRPEARHRKDAAGGRYCSATRLHGRGETADHCPRAESVGAARSALPPTRDSTASMVISTCRTRIRGAFARPTSPPVTADGASQKELQVAHVGAPAPTARSSVMRSGFDGDATVLEDRGHLQRTPELGDDRAQHVERQPDLARLNL